MTKREFYFKLLEVNKTGKGERAENCKQITAIIDKALQAIYFGMEEEVFAKISELDDEIQKRVTNAINRN